MAGSAGKRLVLLVEDDEGVVDLVKTLLAGAHLVISVPNTARARNVLKLQRPDAVILDMVPGAPDGLDLLRELRADPKTAALPVLICTGSQADDLEPYCLNEQADSFIEKPFPPDLFLARLGALMRRAGPPALSWGPLRLEDDGRTAHLGGKALGLTPKEHALLAAVVKAQGKVVAAKALLELLGAEVGESWEKLDRSRLDVHLHNLRVKLGRHHYLVESVPGIGLRMADAALSES